MVESLGDTISRRELIIQVAKTQITRELLDMHSRISGVGLAISKAELDKKIAWLDRNLAHIHTQVEKLHVFVQFLTEDNDPDCTHRRRALGLIHIAEREEFVFRSLVDQAREAALSVH